MKNNKSKIISILQQNGYEVIDNNTYLSFPALWRSGKDPCSVTYYLDTGQIIDWVSAERFDTQELIKRVLNLKSKEESEVFIKNNDINVSFEKSEDIKQIKKFDKELLLNLQNDHSYLLNRGISLSTAQLFRGGVVSKESGGFLRDRYVFPIFNKAGDVIGFSGRKLEGNQSKKKYIHTGSVSSWVWPAFLNNKEIGDSKCCILVESAMCVLSLYDAGVKNSICLFGTNMNLKILNYLIARGVEKIVISLNNEPGNKNIGNNAAEKLKNKLSRYFSPNNIIIKLPFLKDFNEQTIQDNIRWKEELELMIGKKYLTYR